MERSETCLWAGGGGPRRSAVRAAGLEGEEELGGVSDVESRALATRRTWAAGSEAQP